MPDNRSVCAECLYPNDDGGCGCNSTFFNNNPVQFTVAFDCDGTLLNYDGSINNKIVELMKYFYMSGARVIVWSGGGKDYAQRVLDRIMNPDCEGITAMAKNRSLNPDLTFDDQAVDLGKFNCRIKFEQW